MTRHQPRPFTLWTLRVRQPSPHTLWATSVLHAERALQGWPARRTYQPWCYAGHTFPDDRSLWVHPDKLQMQSELEANPDRVHFEVQSYESPLTGPMTRDRFLIEKRMGELAEASASIFRRRTVADTRPIKVQVYEFCSQFKVRVKRLDDWRPLAPGIYSHKFIPYGVMTHGITDGVVAWLVTEHTVYAPIYAGGGSMVVYETVLVQLDNLRFAPIKVAPSESAAPKATKPRKLPKGQLNALDYL